MSSFSLRNIREISNDPLTKFTNEIAKKLSKFLTQNQIDQLEDKEDIYSDGQDLETVVKYHDELQSQKQFTFDVQYYPPFEPDGEFVTCWIRGDNLGNDINDISGFDNHGELYGEPILVDGTPFDYGIHDFGVKSIALRLNRPTSDYVNEEHISIPDHASLQISGITTGMTYFLRFKVGSIADQDGFGRTLFEKIDDSTPNNGIRVLLSSTGRLIVRIKRGGTEYNSQTATSTIAADTVYEVFITYAVSGNVTHIYVNNVDKSLTDPGASSNWHTPLTNHDLAIFYRGGTSENGHTYGDLYDFMIYKEMVLSATQVSRHFTNKWTVENYPFGEVMVTNYYAPYIEAFQSFTSTSFTSGGFTQ